MHNEKLIIRVTFVLAILVCNCVWADVLDSAVINFGMETAADLNGPPYTPDMPLSRVDVSGEPIGSLNFNGWAHSGNNYYMWQIASGSNNEYVIKAAVSMFARFKVGSFSSSETNIVGVFDGNCNPALDAYIIKLNNGIPFFSVIAEGTSTITKVSLTNPIQLNKWYDITGVFDPDNDLLNIYLYDPVSGQLVESAAKPVTFNTIRTAPNDGLNMEVHFFMASCYQDDTPNNALMEHMTIWDMALDASEVAGISGSTAVLITELDGSTQVAESGNTDTYEVKLSEQPAVSVTVTASPDDSE
ncbi:MAG: LamG-like jellyroll fold domain-containing protein, partial [Planctomycetota bacterium]